MTPQASASIDDIDRSLSTAPTANIIMCAISYEKAYRMPTDHLRVLIVYSNVRRLLKRSSWLDTVFQMAADLPAELNQRSEFDLVTPPRWTPAARSWVVNCSISEMEPSSILNEVLQVIRRQETDL